MRRLPKVRIGKDVLGTLIAETANTLTIQGRDGRVKTLRFHGRNTTPNTLVIQEHCGDVKTLHGIIRDITPPAPPTPPSLARRIFTALKNW